MNIGIIGGGAAAMMAAICIKRFEHQADISIIEQNSRLGKKILSTGNGRCNFTNTDIKASYYHESGDRISHILDNFGFDKCIEFFKSIGVEAFEKNSYIYPLSEQASSLLSAMESAIKKLDIKLILDTKVQDIRLADKYSVISDKAVYKFDILIIASGGMASPVLGSDGSLYPILKNLGYRIIKPLPALCAVCPSDKKLLKKLEGIRVKSELSLYIDNSYHSKEYGELQFTSSTISGIVVFQLSRYISRALDKHKKVRIEIDLLPSIADKKNYLEARYKILSPCRLKDFAYGLLNNKLWDAILSKSGFNPDSIIKLTDIDKLSELIKAMRFEINDTADFSKSQVSTGGVQLDELELKSLSSLRLKDMYFVGEVLDVDAICGGYNLHWAWASAYTVAKSIAQRIKV